MTMLESWSACDDWVALLAWFCLFDPDLDCPFVSVTRLFADLGLSIEVIGCLFAEMNPHHRQP